MLTPLYVLRRYPEGNIMDCADLAGLKVAQIIDARWTPCPGPLLEVKKRVGLLKSGEVMEIQSHDPEARGDITAWAEKVGHEFLGFLGSDGHDRIFVRKRAR
jgi:tRNA 2-thiouridine synthesizing protein A